jgi:hypothetical protein
VTNGNALAGAGTGREVVSRDEVRKLETILAKIETLQNQTSDRGAKDRLGFAKDELLRLFKENT